VNILVIQRFGCTSNKLECCYGHVHFNTRDPSSCHFQKECIQRTVPQSHQYTGTSHNQDTKATAEKNRKNIQSLAGRDVTDLGVLRHSSGHSGRNMLITSGLLLFPAPVFMELFTDNWPWPWCREECPSSLRRSP